MGYSRLKELTPLLTPLSRLASAVADALHAQVNSRCYLDLADALQPPLRVIHATALQRSKSAILAITLMSLWLAEWASCGHRRLAEAVDCFLAGAPGGIRLAISRIESRASRYLPSLPHDIRKDLPYLLEGLVLTTLRQPIEGDMRLSRRRLGNVHTPADVAAALVRAALEASADESALYAKWLDPACGTGALLAQAAYAMHSANPQQVTSSLYGVDIDPLMLAAASFVMLTAASQGSPSSTRYSLWRLICSHLAAIDAPLITRSITSHAGDRIPQAVPLREVFSEAQDGFDLVVGNPPFGVVPGNGSLSIRRAIRASAPDGTSGPIYPMFVELMWDLLRDGGGGAMLAPLSLATSVRPELVRLRSFLATAGGTWHLTFFDRSPDSLFGDDVKVRVALVTCTRQAHMAPVLFTSPLIRWQQGKRQGQLATPIRLLATCRIDAASIRRGIPKISCQEEAEALARLAAGSKYGIGALTAAAALASDPPAGRSLAVGTTAYNWLRLYGPSAPRAADAHTLVFPSAEDAYAALACLASTTTFWLWRVKCDGFHVPLRFLLDLPYGPKALGADTWLRLARLGRDLWPALQRSPVTKVNAGRMTLSYRPWDAGHLVAAVDFLIHRALALPTSFTTALLAAVEQMLSLSSYGNGLRQPYYTEGR